MIKEIKMTCFFEGYEEDEMGFDRVVDEYEEEYKLGLDSDMLFYIDGTPVDINIDDLMTDDDPEYYIRDTMSYFFDGGYMNYIQFDGGDIYDLIGTLSPLYKSLLRDRKIEGLGL